MNEKECGKENDNIDENTNIKICLTSPKLRLITINQNKVLKSEHPDSSSQKEDSSHEEERKNGVAWEEDADEDSMHKCYRKIREKKNY